MNLKSKRKGNFSGVATESISVIVLLFVGIFMISLVSDLQAENTLYDYTYTTATNSTDITINSSLNASYTLTITDIASIQDSDPVKTITVILDNQDSGDYTVTGWLNDVSLGTVTAENNTNTTNTFSTVSFVEDADNNITISSTAGAASNLTSSSLTTKYPATREYTSMGSIWSNLTTSVGTIYSVNILLVIVALLAVALAAINSFRNVGNERNGGSVV